MESSNTTRALCVAKLTLASRTPSSFLSVRSLRAAHEAQCIPDMLNVAVFMECLLGRILALAIEQVVVSPLAITHHPAKRFQPPTQSPILVGRGHKLLQFIANVSKTNTVAMNCKSLCPRPTSMGDCVGGWKRLAG